MSLLARVLSLLPLPVIKAGARLQWRHRWLKRGFEWIAAGVRGGGGVIPQGPGRGLRMRAGPSNAGYVLGTSEPDVQRVFELILEPGMIAFDVGANVGFFTLIAARQVGPRGSVVSFEPLEKNADLIEENARANGFSHVAVRREALGARDGEATFLLSEISSWGKLADVGARPARPAGQRQVIVRSLDSLVSAHHVPLPDFVKLDAEGAEVEILLGGATTLAARHPVLLVELHGTNAPVGALLERLGYRSVVLGSSTPVEQAPWDAHVLAFAGDDTRVVSLATGLGNPPGARE